MERPAAVRFPASVLRVAAAALVVIAVVVLLSGAPVAWFLLGVCAVATVVVLVPGLRGGHIVDPLVIVAGFSLVYFVIRPLQLFLTVRDLGSYIPPGADTVNDALLLEKSEIARFVTTKLPGALQPALTHAVGACALFLVMLIIGYRLPAGARLAARASRLGQDVSIRNVRVVVVTSVVLGLLAQLAIVLKTGGVSGALNNTIKQGALKAGFAYYLLAGFSVTGVLVWAGWSRPRTRAAWIAFGLVVFEQLLFFALIGSRTRALVIVLALAVLLHHLWRPLRIRWIIGLVLVGAVLSAAVLGVRNASSSERFPHTLASAPKYILDPRGIVNNLTQFDQLFVATSTIGHSLPYRGGGWLVAAARSYVPSALDPGKPEGGDILFRKAVWGKELAAGRPITIIGDFLYDFGWAGIVAGSLLLGLLFRGLTGLVSGADDGARSYRVAVYSLAVVVLYETVFNTYSIGIGFALTLGLPFLLAVHGLGRLAGPGEGRGTRPGSLLRRRVAARRA